MDAVNIFGVLHQESPDSIREIICVTPLMCPISKRAFRLSAFCKKQDSEDATLMSAGPSLVAPIVTCRFVPDFVEIRFREGAIDAQAFLRLEKSCQCPRELEGVKFFSF